MQNPHGASAGRNREEREEKEQGLADHVSDSGFRGEEVEDGEGVEGGE